MVLLSELYGHLATYPGLLDSCSFKQLDFLIRLCRHLRPKIDLHSPISSSEPPHCLPRYINTFLSNTVCLDGAVVLHLWDALKDFLWIYDVNYEKPYFSVNELSLIDHSGGKTVHKKEKLGSYWTSGLRCC